MILVDANLLIYAVNSDLPQHKQARAWWEETLSGAAVVGIPLVVLLAFLRICTNPRVFAKPMSPESAIAYIDEWLDQPAVRLVGPGAGHWAVLRNLLVQTGMSGNLTTDAHIAALALEQGYSIYSADNDFRRFPGLKHVNPLAGR
ncbi:type II toxin-antitoxin system VapC family toxin [Accumulibacter sp.]|uniref:type II toxin-antitoxin system VapC family toxin n=1 Tax=Accumulibacter sp. TaxID=2053492 RepID=UPI0025F2C632|nr:type II toxin-antitoxin system VapC family toxin [Accumulibacter sp.]MCM8613141.1 type II toxin-antitoxin system VapC family toxin [Accumulibacter sp.]MCM8636572.1 type II toxin-antitoxin system VapC family toxin [Accumulibacter sp.]MCM8640194.1 type II toxin-antitoxin system VapC family toxin [Accumulibacter sp.]